MATRTLTPKTKLVDGVRVDLGTGLPYQGTGGTAIRDLQIQSGDSAAQLTQSRGQAQGVASSVPSSSQFGNALLQLLKRHQQLGTKKFQEASIRGQEEQANRISARTPSSLIGASPSVQSSVRQSAASAVQPTIEGARSNAQTLSEQINSLGSAIDSARQFASDFEASKQRQQESAQNIINSAFALGGASGLEAVDLENPQIWKIAGLDKDTLVIAAKAKEKFEQDLARQKAAGTDELTSSQKTAVNTLDTVLKSLSDYRALYDRLVGTSGVNLTGVDAGELSGAYNALLFQIAQAAGTGALQAADRQVVEAMIPNPTSKVGAFGSFLRGGKEGALGSIDQAKGLFQNRKDAIVGPSGATTAEGQLIHVRRISDGEPGRIPENEFDPNLYEKI